MTKRIGLMGGWSPAKASVGLVVSVVALAASGGSVRADHSSDYMEPSPWFWDYHGDGESDPRALVNAAGLDWTAARYESLDVAIAAWRDHSVFKIDGTLDGNHKFFIDGRSPDGSQGPDCLPGSWAEYDERTAGVTCPSTVERYICSTPTVCTARWKRILTMDTYLHSDGSRAPVHDPGYRAPHLRVGYQQSTG